MIYKDLPSPADADAIKSLRVVSPIGRAQWCKLFSPEDSFDVREGRKARGSVPQEYSTAIVFEEETDEVKDFLDYLKRIKDTYKPAYPNPWKTTDEGKPMLQLKCKAERPTKGGQMIPWRPMLFSNETKAVVAGEDPAAFQDPGYGIGNNSLIQVKFRCWPHDMQGGGISTILVAAVIHRLEKYIPENPLDGFDLGGIEIDGVVDITPGQETPF